MKQLPNKGSKSSDAAPGERGRANSPANTSTMSLYSPSNIVQLQKSFGNAAVGRLLASDPPLQRKENGTGMPSRLKNGLEQLSGMDLSQVRVHYNSDKPAQLDAHAYAQGNDIHLAPGQERHLPHEGWHIVQQRQGVTPTLQMKNGLNINDDDRLEREADLMGQRALDVSAAEAGPLSTQAMPPASSAAQSPIQFVRVKLQTARSKGGSDKYVIAKDSDKDGVDTSTMKLSEKQRVLKDLGKDKKNASYAQELIKEINMITGGVSEKDIIAYGKKLDELLQKKSEDKLDKEGEPEIEEISFRLLSAMEYLGSFDQGEHDASRIKALLQVQMEKLFKLDDKALHKARELAEVEFDDVTPEEIAAYREDIKSGGVWGGGAEASVIAQGVGIHLDLLILDSDGNYVKAETIGDQGGAAAAYSILNLGTHYVVVDAGFQTGNAHLKTHIRFNPAPDGDCMFNALHYALTNGDRSNELDWQPPNGAAVHLTEKNFVKEARNIVSGALSDESVQLSVEEILLSGQAAGVGDNLKRFLEFRKFGKEDLLEMINTYRLNSDEVINKLKSSGLVPSSRKETLPQLLDKYESIQSTKPQAAEKFLHVIMNMIYSKSVEMNELIDGDPSDKLERTLRKEESEKYRHMYEVDNAAGNMKQLIVTVGSGEEFVLDRIGQLVPRYVFRSISDYNIAELDKEGFIYPSNQSPVGKSGSDYDGDLKKKYSKETSTTGSGIGDNKIAPTNEMLHVEGAKPSRFLSTTKEQKGTVNPEGVSFGSSLYRIDLSYIDPAFIADLSSDKGISYYLLGNYKQTEESQPDKAGLIGKARLFNRKQEESRDDKKKTEFNAKDAEKEDRTLSAKEWQALMDVVRTSEVLINTKIPEDALKKA